MRRMQEYQQNMHQLPPPAQAFMMPRQPQQVQMMTYQNQAPARNVQIAPRVQTHPQVVRGRPHDSVIQARPSMPRMDRVDQ